MNRLVWLYTKKIVKLDKAFSLSSQTLKAFPSKPEFIGTLLEILYVHGKSEGAEEKNQEAIKLVPNDSYYNQQL